MVKTPEEIKRGLELCQVDECFGEKEDCPYASEPSLCVGSMCGDAFTYIQQLEREREAAVADLAVTKNCKVCKYVTGDAHEEPCWSCGIAQRNWEWRGVEEEKHG